MERWMKGVKDAYELEQISNESSRGTRKPAEYSRFFSVVSFFRFESTLLSRALRSSYRLQ